MSRYTPKQYAQALFDLLETKQGSVDALIKEFAATVIANYDRALLPKIVLQFRKLERAKAGRHEVVVTSARALEASALEAIKKKVGAKAHIQQVVDPSVLGGLKVLINDEIIVDGTYTSRTRRLVEALLSASR